MGGKKHESTSIMTTNNTQKTWCVTLHKNETKENENIQQLRFVNNDSFMRPSPAKKYKSEAICWHCELQVIFPHLIAGFHPLCSMKCNQTVIQCCRCTACGRDGLASGARARVRQGVAVSEVQPRQNHTKTASLDGWTEAFHMSSLWSAASRHLLFFFFSL